MQNPFLELSEQIEAVQQQIAELNTERLPALMQDVYNANAVATDAVKFATARQLAKRYGVHFNTVQNWHRAGYFDKHKIDGVSLYEVATVDAFIKSKGSPPNRTHTEPQPTTA